MMKVGIRRKYLFYAITLLSSLIASMTVGFDAIITSKMMELYPAESTAWIYSFSAFLLGSMVSLAISLVLLPKIGKRRLGSYLDPSFEGIRFPRKEELRYHVLAGIGNAISTVGYFYVLSLLADPSAVIPFFRVVILYLLIVEMITEKNAPTLIEIQSSVIVTLGAILGSISISGEIEVLPLAIMFLVVNPGWVLFSISQRRLKLLKIDGRANDSINIRLWNLLFSLVFVTIFMVLQDLIFGTNYLMESLDGLSDFFWLVSVSMAITFFSYVLYIRALGMGKASVTEAVRASIVIFSIPMSLLLSLYIPIPVPRSPVMWLIKMIGIILVVLGILSFALTQVTAYIFIRLRPGANVAKTVEKIWKIRGVESVSAVAGRYDVIAKIRTRTLLKGYERIIRKLETMPEIQEFRWNSVLKEWENV